MGRSNRWFAGALLGLTVLLTACQPKSVPRNPAEARVVVGIDAEGNAHGDLFLAPDHEDDLYRIAQEAGEALFPGTEVRPSVDRNDGGHPYAHFAVPDAYRPGRSPQVQVPAAGLVEVLTSRDITEINLRMCGPRVPLTFGSDVPPSSSGDVCASWVELDPEAPGPSVSVTMRPEPVRWWLEVGLVVATGAAVGIGIWCTRAGLTPRRRWQLRFAALLAGVASTTCIFTGAVVQSDNLGVAGQLAGFPLVAASVFPLVVLPLALAACALFAISLDRTLPPGPRAAIGGIPGPGMGAGPGS